MHAFKHAHCANGKSHGAGSAQYLERKMIITRNLITSFVIKTQIAFKINSSWFYGALGFYKAFTF